MAIWMHKLLTDYKMMEKK